MNIKTGNVTLRKEISIQDKLIAERGVRIIFCILELSHGRR